MDGDEFLAELRAIREEELRPIREEAGWPEFPEDGVPPDVLTRYVELLESAVVGKTSALRAVARFRHA